MDPWSNTATDTGNYPYLSFFLSVYLSFSVTLSISFSFSHYLIIQQDSIFSRFLSIHENRIEKFNKKKKKKPAPGSSRFRWRRPHESHTVLLNVYKTLRIFSFSFSPIFFPFFWYAGDHSTFVCTSNSTRAYVSFIRYVYRV